MISIIAAVGKGLELGYKGDLVWRLPEDLKYFKEVTKGHTVLMGYNTFMSLPKLLPGRKHVVLTREPEKLAALADEKGFSGAERPEVVGITELFEFVDKYKGTSEELFIIGGGSVYKQLISMADKLYLTEISADFPEADVYFPDFDKSEYNRVKIGEGNEDGLNYEFIRYVKLEGES